MSWLTVHDLKNDLIKIEKKTSDSGRKNYCRFEVIVQLYLEQYLLSVKHIVCNIYLCAVFS